MPKLSLGATPVTPAKFISSSDTEFTAGNGISSDSLLNNEIAVNEKVLRDVSTGSNSFIDSNSDQSKQKNDVSNTLVIGKGAYTAGGNNNTVIGTSSKVNNTGNSNVVIGTNSYAYYNANVAIGYQTVAANGSIIIGYNTRSGQNNYYNVVIGNDMDSWTYAKVIGTRNTLVGQLIKPQQSDDLVLIGQDSGWDDSNNSSKNLIKESVGIGSKARLKKASSVAIGYNSLVSSENSVVIGHTASAQGSYSGTGPIAIGYQATVSNRHGLAIGYKSQVSAEQGFAIGASSRSSGPQAIAIGNGAQAWGAGSIQIGNGVNSAPGTFQVTTYNGNSNHNYMLMNSDGTIPYERMSTNTPSTNQVLTFDGTKMIWQDSLSALPVASANTLGAIKVGDGLSITEGGVLSANAAQNWGDIKGTLSDQTDLQGALDLKIDKFNTMPTASSAYSNKIVQYTGASNSTYMNGYFYKCLLSGSTYVWTQYNVQPGVPVINNLTSSSITSALSAAQGKLLKESIENISTIGRFLAMWDSDTGEARYLSTVPFTYEAGDYFIIASVPAHGTWSASVVTTHSSGTSVSVTDISKWEKAFGKTAKTVTFVRAEYYFTNDYDERTFTVQEVSSVLGLTIANFSSVGDTFRVVYTAPVYYKPDGRTYTGPSTVVDTENTPELSDMYYYTGPEGNHWVFMGNSQKTIAIDEDIAGSGGISRGSTNPVQNTKVADALDLKVSTTDDPNQIYGTDDQGNQTHFGIGEGLAVDDSGNITNTKTSAVWGNIENPEDGDITAQTDLIEYINSHAGKGAIGVPQLSSVQSKQIDTLRKYDEHITYKSYKGEFSDIIFTTNMDKDTLIKNMNEYYVTFARYTRKYDRYSPSRDKEVLGRVGRMVTLNDRVRRLSHRLQCWKMNFDDAYDSKDPRNWFYFYVNGTYNSASELENDDPSIYTSMGTGEFSGYATNLNCLANAGSYDDFSWHEGDLQRCPEYDIDTYIPCGRNVSSFLNTNSIIHCREYIRGDDKYFLWCDNWEDDGDVYAYLNNDALVSNYIADFYDQNDYYNDAGSVIEEFDGCEYIDRYDLDFQSFNFDDYDLTDLSDYLYNDTVKEGLGATGAATNWKVYFFDYPIRPILLSQCEVMIQRQLKREQEPVYNAGEFVSLRELALNGLWNTYMRSEETIVLKLPWDTYYLWMRLAPMQKRRFHDDEWYYKNVLTYSLRDDLGGRAFGGLRGHMFTAHQTSKMHQRVEFNLCEPTSVVRGTPSRSTPIAKKLVITGNSAQFLVD